MLQIFNILRKAVFCNKMAVAACAELLVGAVFYGLNSSDIDESDFIQWSKLLAVVSSLHFLLEVVYTFRQLNTDALVGSVSQEGGSLSDGSVPLCDEDSIGMHADDDVEQGDFPKQEVGSSLGRVSSPAGVDVPPSGSASSLLFQPLITEEQRFDAQGSEGQDRSVSHSG